MKIEGQAALVTGGGSGLGEQTARELARRGARVTVLDVNGAWPRKPPRRDRRIGVRCDITDTESVKAALAVADERHGPARLLDECRRRRHRKAHRRQGWSRRAARGLRRVVKVDLVGAYNVRRLVAARMAELRRWPTANAA